jgi:hypothetical protein
MCSALAVPKAFDRMKAFTPLLDRRADAEESVTSNDGGLVWRDLTGQQLITGIVVCHRTVA